MPATQDVVIRRASPGEAEIVAAITMAAYARYVPLLGRQPRPMTMIIAKSWPSTQFGSSVWAINPPGCGFDEGYRPRLSIASR
jgi:hypothetical protein